jgi:hypothetical protein
VDWITLTDEASDLREPAVDDGFASTVLALIAAKKITPIPEAAQQCIREGRFADVPVLAGWMT